jgi:hypothetical protein
MKYRQVITTIMILAAMFMVGAVILGQAANSTPKFSAADKETITDFYKHLDGTLAPGSLDRKGFPPDVDRELVGGGKLPAQLEKRLEALPRELEKKLAEPSGGYQLYRLGNHVLILRKSDLRIADILKNVG